MIDRPCRRCFNPPMMLLTLELLSGRELLLAPDIGLCA